MIKKTQTIRRQQPTNCLKVFNHFVGLPLKGLMFLKMSIIIQYTMFGSIIDIIFCKCI